MLLKLRPIIAEFNDKYDVKIRVDEQKYIGRDFYDSPDREIFQEITSKIGSKLYIGKIRLQSQNCPEIGSLASTDGLKSRGHDIFVRGEDKTKDSSVFYCKERADLKLNLESIILNLDFWFGAQGHYNDEREDTEPDF